MPQWQHSVAPIDYSKWDDLVTSEEEERGKNEEGDDDEEDQEAAYDGYWEMYDCEEEGGDAAQDDYPSSIEEEEEEEVGSQVENDMVQADDDYVLACEEGDEGESGHEGRKEAEAQHTEDDDFNESVAHNKLTLLHRFGLAEREMQRRFSEAEGLLTARGIPPTKVDELFHCCKQQQQQQFASYINMLQAMEENQFEENKARAVLPLLAQWSTDIQGRLAAIIEDDLG